MTNYHDERLQLLTQFKEAEAKQKEHSAFIREYKAADLPLLAEWRIKECAELGEVMHAAIDRLKQLDQRLTQ